MIFFFSVKNPFDVILTQNHTFLQVCFQIFFKLVARKPIFVKIISIKNTFLVKLWLIS